MLKIVSAVVFGVGAMAALASAAVAQSPAFVAGDRVEATVSANVWMTCTVVQYNEHWGSYTLACDGRDDTVQGINDAEHIRRAGPVSLSAARPAAPRSAPGPATSADRGSSSSYAAPQDALPALGPAPARSAGNVLLGRWRLTEGDCNSLILEFSPHLSRDYNKASGGYQAYWGQREVESYVRSDNQVFVVVPNAGHSTVNVRDENHIVPDSMFQCTYTRM